MLGLSFDGVPAPEPEAEAAYAGPVGARGERPADEPVAAERRFTARRGPSAPAETPTEQPTQTRTRTPAR
jgi:hypothetical protein